MDIKINVNNLDMTIPKGTTLFDLSKKFSSDYRYEIIIAKVDGIYRELTDTINKECKIEFYDLMDRGANNIYLNGLIYLTLYSFRKLFDNNIIVRHSLDKGLYIETTNKIEPSDIIKLDEKMKEVVKESLPITRTTVARLEAISYYNSIGYNTKRDLLKYNTASYITLYKLGNLYDYFYSLMPINTNQLSHFALTYLNENGFVLRFPTIYMDSGIKEFEQRKNIYNLYSDSRKWAKNLNLVNSVDLNKTVSSGNIDDVIRVDEIMKNNQLMELAKNIVSKPETKVVLLSGPSSTGKTTTTNKLSLCLKALGKKTLVISMDDFFKDRVDTPLDKEGNPDYECFEALDLEVFNECMKKLVNKEEVLFPVFNFIAGKKEYKNKYKIDEDTIIVIEGIHALNPKFSSNIPDSEKIRIYLSALNQLNVDDHVRISTTDNRLLRRIVRDNRTRGRSVEVTLEGWNKVREGEEKYIFPYQDNADYTFNTAMIYELGVLKTYVEPLLYAVDVDSPYYNEALRLINFLRVFLPISPESIPDDSILREFIGGGCFKI